MLQLSLVIPVYSGAEYLASLCAEIDKLAASLAETEAPLQLSEAIFVDDASIDDSPEQLRVLNETYPWLQVVTMSRNFGQHGATVAGILHSSGDWVASLDEDLQHPPTLIPSLVHTAVESGHDVIFGAPADVAHSAARDLASRVSKKFVAAMSGSPALPLASSFRVMRGPVARAAAATASHEAYFDASLLWYTDRAHRVDLDITDQRVQSGVKSGYSPRRLLSHFRRMLTSGDMRTLRLIGGIGVVGVIAASVMIARMLYLLVTGDLDRSTAGWPSTFSALLFFGGILSLQIVVLTEYAISSALHLRGKPTYFAVDRSSDEILRQYFGNADSTQSP